MEGAMGSTVGTYRSMETTTVKVVFDLKSADVVNGSKRGFVVSMASTSLALSLKPNMVEENKGLMAEKAGRAQNRWR
jgi:hypothetical protein